MSTPVFFDCCVLRSGLELLTAKQGRIMRILIFSMTIYELTSDGIMHHSQRRVTSSSIFGNTTSHTTFE